MMSQADRLQRRLRAAREIAAGKSPPEVAAAVGLSVRYVENIRTLINAPRMPAKRAVRTFEILAALLNTKDTCEEIGARYGITKQAVWQVGAQARAAGIVVRPREAAEGAA